MGSDASTVTNFCACFLKYDSTWKPMVGSQDFGCFLRLRLKFYIVLFQTHYPPLTVHTQKRRKIKFKQGEN